MNVMESESNYLTLSSPQSKSALSATDFQASVSLGVGRTQRCQECVREEPGFVLGDTSILGEFCTNTPMGLPTATAHLQLEREKHGSMVAPLCAPVGWLVPVP